MYLFVNLDAFKMSETLKSLLHMRKITYSYRMNEYKTTARASVPPTHSICH